MKKLWSGDVPLSVAYWVYGWLLPMGLALVFVILGAHLAQRNHKTSTPSIAGNWN